jgi:hypothetical protein
MCRVETPKIAKIKKVGRSVALSLKIATEKIFLVSFLNQFTFLFQNKMPRQSTRNVSITKSGVIARELMDKMIED